MGPNRGSRPISKAARAARTTGSGPGGVAMTSSATSPSATSPPESEGVSWSRMGFRVSIERVPLRLPDAVERVPRRSSRGVAGASSKLGGPFEWRSVQDTSGKRSIRRRCRPTAAVWVVTTWTATSGTGFLLAVRGATVTYTLTAPRHGSTPGSP
jgi:hypothetical protein